MEIESALWLDEKIASYKWKVQYMHTLRQAVNKSIDRGYYTMYKIKERSDRDHRCKYRVYECDGHAVLNVAYCI